MKILHVIDSAGLYGAERVLIELMREQTARGAEPVLCSVGNLAAGEKQVEAEALRQGLPVRPIRFRDGPNPVGSAKLVRLAREIGAHLLHSHGYKSNILLGMLPRAVRGIPMIATLHGWTHGGGFDRMRVYQWLDAQALSRLDRVVVVSRSMLEDPRLHFSDPAPVWIPNGISVPTDNGDRVGDEWEGFRAEGLLLGSIGRLSPEKGHDVLIRALARLVSRGVDCRLFILGEGESRKPLQELVGQLELTDRVFLAGYRDRAYRYLQFCDVWVLPSLTEGLPITLLEAMQQARPIVATRVGAVPDVLDQGKAGLIVEPGDVDGLVRAIEDLRHDPQLASRLGETARVIAHDEYSARAMERRYHELYSELLRPDEVPL